MALWRARAASSAFSNVSELKLLKPFCFFNNCGANASHNFTSDAAQTYPRNPGESMMNRMMYSDINSQFRKLGVACRLHQDTVLGSWNLGQMRVEPGARCQTVLGSRNQCKDTEGACIKIVFSPTPLRCEKVDRFSLQGHNWYSF